MWKGWYIRKLIKSKSADDNLIVPAAISIEDCIPINGGDSGDIVPTSEDNGVWVTSKNWHHGDFYRTSSNKFHKFPIEISPFSATWNLTIVGYRRRQGDQHFYTNEIPPEHYSLDPY